MNLTNLVLSQSFKSVTKKKDVKNSKDFVDIVATAAISHIICLKTKQSDIFLKAAGFSLIDAYLLFTK